MGFTDGFRRNVIREVRYEPALWDLSHPSSNSYGARSYAWQTIAYKLNVAHRALDLRRMWRGWLRSYVNYRLRTSQRKPKYYHEMHFLHAVSSDHLLSLKYRF
ncbi:hypothetical protein AAVH_40220 [Aphelenchoides avenae]|nr:hypothetical protein AAVH_40220 [Aphelenchus avenae]